MKTTNYFTTSVMARRPYLKVEWIECVLSHPIRTEVQANGRIRRWAFIPELEYLRVVTEPDGETVHNVFQTAALSYYCPKIVNDIQNVEQFWDLEFGLWNAVPYDLSILSRYRYALHPTCHRSEYRVRRS